MRSRTQSSLTAALLSCLAAGLSSCATAPDKVKPTAVSSSVYAQYDCEMLRQELIRLNAKVDTLSGMQRQQASNDAWTVGASLLFYPPALLLLAGSDVKKTLAQSKGEQAAVLRARTDRNCST